MNPGAAATRAKAALKAAAAGKAQWAVAFDAGSSGTRVYIYNFTGVSALRDKGTGMEGRRGQGGGQVQGKGRVLGLPSLLDPYLGATRVCEG